MNVSGVNFEFALKSFLALLLTCCFVVHVWEQVSKFVSERTMTLEEMRTLDRMKMPDITICSDEAYKSPGFHFNKTSFEANAYTWEEIFHPDTERFLKEKNFTVTEVLSQFRGRCFTLSSPYQFMAREYLTVSLNPSGPEAYIFVHGEREQDYVVAENFPYEVKTETVGEGSDCILERKVDYHINIPKHKKICSDWSSEEFSRCGDLQLRKAIRDQNFKCSVVWWEKFFPNGTRECDTNIEGDLEEVIRIGEWVDDPFGFLLRFSSNPEEYGCPRTCEQENYDISCREFNKEYEYSVLQSQPSGGDQGGVEMWLFYLRTVEEREEEILLYDFSAIVAGVGGSLGLFLGFSCLQGLSSVVDYACGWYRDRGGTHNNHASINASSAKIRTVASAKVEHQAQ